MSNILLEHARRQQAAQQQAPVAPQLGVRQSPLTIMQAQQRAQQQAQPTGNMFLDGAAGASPSQGNIFLGGQTAGRTQTAGAGGGQGQSQWGRGLGILVNNPITQTAIKPLEVLDYGRRAAVLGVEALTGLDSGDDRSIAARLNDPTTGFGQIAPDTGMKWLDRGIGFVGDVALDPLTYFTLGTGKLAGGAARLSAAARLADQSAGTAADAARVARMARLGVNAANPAERATVGAGEAGLRWMGKRIPGTTTFAEVTGEMLARGRARVMDTRVLDPIRRARGPQELAKASQRLLRGTSTDPISDAMAVSAYNARRQGKGAFRAKFGTDVQRLAQSMSKEERGASAAIERGVTGGVADRWRELMGAIRREAADAGIEMGDLGPNYVPHIWTPEGRAWLMGNDPGAEEARRLFNVRAMDGSDAVHSREIVTGVYRINGQQIVLQDGSIDEINTVLRQLAPDVPKFVEDDLQIILRRYYDGMEANFGAKKALDHLVASKSGVAHRLADHDFDQVVDVKATKRARKEEIGRLKGARDEAQRRVDALTADVKRLTGRAQTRVEKNLGKQLRELDGEIDRAQKAWERASRKERPLRREVEAAERALLAAEAKTERMLRKLERLHNEAKRDATRNRRYQDWADVVEVRAMVEDELRDNLGKVVERQSVNDQAAWAAATRVERARLAVDVLRRELAQAKGVPTGTAAHMQRSIDELAQVAARAADDPALLDVADLLAEASATMLQVEMARADLAGARSALAMVRDNDFPDVMVDVLRAGWERVGDDLLSEADAVVVRTQLAESFNFVVEELGGGAFARLFDNYTAFFKAFATATPGFHVRNFISAAFMNLTDGVGVRRMTEALGVWRKFRADPRKFMETAPVELREALEATFATGAGGRWSAEALDTSLLSVDGVRRVTDNPWTRASNRAGEWVEGPIRLATAMDTIANGGTVQEAMDRITRLHFDYSQVSRADQHMRRMIPFWTFMSRNLPLQVQQMWLKPRMYAGYASFVRNVRADNGDEPTPLWWQERGAFGLGVDAPWSGNPLYAMPDLQHIGLQQDLNKGEDLQRLLADFNPMLRVPMETMVADKQFFSDRPFRDGDNRWAYAATQSVPFIPQLQRLALDQSGYADERRVQSWANWLGIPLRELTPGQVEAELRRLAALERG